MRILMIVFVAAVAGIFVGGALGYIETRSDSRDLLPPPSPGAATQSLGPATSPIPRAQVDQPHFQFGTMQRGTTRSHDFVIRNVGGGPLTVKVGPTSCKCTLGDVTNRPLAPGESTNVRLEWSAKSETGMFRQTAILETNDPLQREIELSIEGQVVEATGVEPRDLLFDKVPFGQSKSAHVYVMAMLQDELVVSDPEFSDPETRDYFDVQVERVPREELPDSAARDGVRITVTTEPGMPIGRFSQWLSVRTNLPEAERLEIPILGRVVGDISIHGTGWNEEEGVLALGRINSQEGRKARLNFVVRGKDAADVKFELKSADPPELRVNIGEPKQLGETLLHVPVEVEVPPGTRPMARLNTNQGEEARIVLATTHSTNKEIVLGVRFSVEK